MAGQINGLIDREGAWRMWQPYQERGVSELDGSLNLENITPDEAMRILYDADGKTQSNAWGYWYDENDNRYWMEGLKDCIEAGADEGLLEILWKSHERQQQYAERRRVEARKDEPKFLKSLSMGATALCKEGFLTKPQVDQIHNHLLAPDGTPYLRYLPMSNLEYARLGLKYDGEAPDRNSNDATDFNLGLLRNSLSMHRSTLATRRHNRVHESVHAYFSGVEIWDITRRDGWRYPQASVIGLHAEQPTTDIVVGDDFSKTENIEANEGWTEFITGALIRVVPSLADTPKNYGGYGNWAVTMGHLKQSRPDLFRKITDTVLTESTPQNPTAKREALADMHAYADRVLDDPHALTRLFQNAGGGILDIFTKGKTKNK